MEKEYCMGDDRYQQPGNPTHPRCVRLLLFLLPFPSLLALMRLFVLGVSEEKPILSFGEPFRFPNSCWSTYNSYIWLL